MELESRVNELRQKGLGLAAISYDGPEVLAAFAKQLTIQPQPFVCTLPMKYPPSQIYFFEPLNERVPVFQKPFTMVQDVILEGTPQAQATFRGKNSLTLTGIIEYQACDDKICYKPATVPVSWTLNLRPIVFERTAPGAIESGIRGQTYKSRVWSNRR